MTPQTSSVGSRDRQGKEMDAAHTSKSTQLQAHGSCPEKEKKKEYHL